MSTLADGAEILVRTCAAVRKGERGVIVTDDARLRIAEAVRKAADAAGAHVVVVMTTPGTSHNEEPAPAVAAAMAQADVVYLVVTLALAHTRATREAIDKGARVVSMTAFTERMMRDGGLFTDFAARKPFCDGLADRLTDAGLVRITNPAGTDLTLSLEGRTGNSHPCIVRRPGFTSVPNIEANICPLEGQGEGVLVVDGSIPYHGVGVIDEPVTLTIRNGVVSSIAGGSQARSLDDLLARRRDPSVYDVTRFAIGLNPECIEFTGEMLNDEGVNGTIHLGVGTSANPSGVQAGTHFDAMIRAPSVRLDGELVLQDGEFMIS